MTRKLVTELFKPSSSKGTRLSRNFLLYKLNFSYIPLFNGKGVCEWINYFLINIVDMIDA